MPWKEQSVMSQRKEFIQRASQTGRNMSQLCEEYGISRKTGYKWLGRYQAEGILGLEDRSRRPHHSPKKTSLGTEQLVLEARQLFPEWGGRKLGKVLRNMGYQDVPSASTITSIL